MTYNQIISEIKKLGTKKNVLGMAKFGIRPKVKVCGTSIVDVRKIAKRAGRNHQLALRLWNSGFHEARHLANLVAEVDKLTKAQMNKWIKDFDSWDICDQTCSNLFDKVPWAHEWAISLTKRKPEFEKRTGFVLMATLSVHDKKAGNKDFIKFFSYIKKEAIDERNFVKKAVNWALRQIGKRNINLNKQAVKLAREIKKIDSRSAHWIANDAIRELTSEAVQKRLIIENKK